MLLNIKSLRYLARKAVQIFLSVHLHEPCAVLLNIKSLFYLARKAVYRSTVFLY